MTGSVQSFQKARDVQGLPVCPPKAITAGDMGEQEWKDRAANFAYADTLRRSKKEQVTHGPNWDAKLAGA